MTLTVRLDEMLESALERYCLAAGVTKSSVVQESLAVYLGRQTLAPKSVAEPAAGAGDSPHFRVFADAGWVGSGELGGASADKAAVRGRVAQRIRRAVR